MSKRDEGGYAFPARTGFAEEHRGISLRDYFAAQVIGHVAASDNDGTIKFDAETAYRYADAMLAARKKES